MFIFVTLLQIDFEYMGQNTFLIFALKGPNILKKFSISFEINHSRPVNLHPPFLFCKHGSVCDPGKKVQNVDIKKNRVIAIQKEKRPDCLFSFWVTMTLVFGTLLFSKSRVPYFFSGSQTDPGFQNKNSGYRLTGWALSVSQVYKSDSLFRNWLLDPVSRT